MAQSSNLDPAQLLRRVSEVLEACSIPYCVGGSIASGIRGEWRSTNDIDFVVLITEPQAEALCRELAPTCFADSIAACRAVREGRSFNIIDKESVLKLDFFTRSDDFQKSQIARATAVNIPGADFSARIATAEDTILAKLRWYQLGGEQSERQWRDISTVYRVNRATLDRVYIESWVGRLGVGELWLRLTSRN